MVRNIDLKNRPHSHLYHAREIPGISQLQHNVQFIVLNEGAIVFDNIGMVQLFQQIDFLDTILSRFSVHHFEDLRIELNYEFIVMKVVKV